MILSTAYILEELKTAINELQLNANYGYYFSNIINVSIDANLSVANIYKFADTTNIETYLPIKPVGKISLYGYDYDLSISKDLILSKKYDLYVN